ncbi:ATP-binding protein [Streptomyces sp. DT171]|uniref:ATP-binding protein n=1 Tax=Streptomyces sp. DT171 TaxID=3416524 RepID=UPI003CF47869
MTSVSAQPRSTPPLPQRGARYRLVVPNTSVAPRIVRDFLGLLLRSTGHPTLADDARLCVSEVVTNAHRHTRSPLIRVGVVVTRRQVTVYVTDDEPGALPARRGGEAVGAVEDEGGRGLFLLSGLAARWGVSSHSGGALAVKTVWFTLAETHC